MQNPIEHYYALRQQLDELCSDLSAIHSGHMNCRQGCDQCCMDFSIFPVEFYAIKAEAADLLHNGIRGLSTDKCPFLSEGSCIIYNSRPIICRTQGLPLLFMNDENWELSACELNFTSFDPEGFSPENTFPLDRFNSSLYLINQAFIKTYPEKQYNTTELIPLRLLLPGTSV